MSELLTALRAPARDVMGAIPLALGASDVDGRVFFANAALERLLGAAPGCLAGSRIEDWLSEEEGARYRALQGELAKGRPQLVELSLNRPGDTQLPLRLMMAPMLDRERRFVGTIGMFLSHAASDDAFAEHVRDGAQLARAVLGEVVDAVETARGTPAPTLEELRERDPAVATLSERELEVTRRILAGERTGEIAAALGIRPNTVRNHLKAVFRKLDVDRQPALIARLRGEKGEGRK